MKACPAWSYDLELAVQPVSASMAREFVRGHLLAQGLARLNDDAVLVVSELATNAMVHAQTPFTVSLQAFEQTLLLEVEDGSRTGPVQVAARVLDTGGRGLTIVTLLSRAWGVDAHTQTAANRCGQNSTCHDVRRELG
jgi:anti-sigma regulatory factor (Ser/Thr protein kinase)